MYMYKERKIYICIHIHIYIYVYIHSSAATLSQVRGASFVASVRSFVLTIPYSKFTDHVQLLGATQWVNTEPSTLNSKP